MATEERLEQLERSLQQAGSALQAANYRISSLETAAGTTTSAASMVDMRVLGKPSIFAGDEASWKSWSFVMLSFLGSSLARTTCIDGKGTNQCRRHAERTSHIGRAGVEQTAILHAQSEYERRSAEETAERA